MVSEIVSSLGLISEMNSLNLLLLKMARICQILKIYARVARDGNAWN